MKVKIFSECIAGLLQEKINDFIKNVEVVDIKYTQASELDNHCRTYPTAYILYEEKGGK